MFQCDDTRGCAMQFWPPDDQYMCSTHVEAWNKLIVKQKFCASSLLITEINILRCTVSKTSKFVFGKFPPCHQSRSYKRILSNFFLREGLFLYPIVYKFSCHKIHGTSDNNLKFLYTFLYRDSACHSLILNKWAISIKLF